MAKRFSIEAVFKAVDKMSAPVSRMQNKIGKFTRKMDRGLRKINKTVGRFAQKMKKGALIVGASLAIMAAGLLNVINVGADFGRAIGSAAAKFPDDIKRATKAFEELKDAARDVGRTTEFTATQAAQGLNFLAKAGFNAKFAIDSLKSFADFTTAAELDDFGRATDIATDALGAFGLNTGNTAQKVKSLNRIMDVMVKTTIKSNTNVEELFETIKLGGAAATSSGQSIETYGALMGTLAGNSIKASIAGTSVRTIMLALIGVGQKSAATFKKLNIKMADNAGNIRNSISVLDELRKKLGKLSQIERQRTIEAIFGKRALSAASIFLSETGKGLRDFERILLESGGTVQRVAGFIRNDVRGSIDSFKSAIESAKLSIFNMNEGALKDTIDRMTEWIRANEELIASKIGGFLASLIENLDGIVAVLKGIGIGLAVFGTLFISLKTLILIMTAVNLVMAANPAVLIFLAIVAAIALVIAAILLIRKHWDKLKAVFSNLPIPVKIALAALAGPFLLIMTAIQFIIDNWDKITGAFSAVGRFLGFGDEDEKEQSAGERPGTISPQERTARFIEESRTTNTAEVTIRDETGKAELTSGTLGPGLKLQSSGGF